MKKFIFLLPLLLSVIFVEAQFGDQKTLLSTQLTYINNIEVTDINNDNFNDIIISSEVEGKIIWYKNQAGIISLSKNIIANIPSIESFDFGDIDGDGSTDIVYASNKGGVLGRAKNNNSGASFSTNTITLDSTLYVKITDLNQDGKNDIVAIIENGRKLVWYENLTGNTFSNKILIDSITDSNYPFFKFYVQDLNNDNKVDVLPSDGFNIIWHENIGGLFNKNTLLKPYPNSLYKQLMPGKITNDSLIDILADEIGVYENIGNGFSLSSYISFNSNNTWEYDLFDIDNDGDDDISATTVSSSFQYSLLKLFENSNNNMINSSYYHKITNYNTGGKQLITHGDLNNDGFKDIVIASNNNTLSDLCWYPNSLGVINDNKIPFSFKIDNNTSIKAVDGNNDAKKDFLIINNGIFYIENNGNSVFESFIVYDGYGMKNATIVDFNLDGLNDVIACGADDIFWHENLGGGKFGPSQFIHNYGPSLPPIAAVNATDFDNDGDVDIVFRTYYALLLLTNNGGLFTRSSLTSWFNGSAGNTDIELTDFNKDGYTDFTTIHLHINDTGSGIFNRQTGFFNTNDGIIDCDLDGDMDVVASGINNNLHWGEYDSLSNIANHEITTTGNVNNSNPELPFDINGDGLYDVLYTDNANNVNILIQDYDTINFGTTHFLHNPSGNVLKFFKIDLDSDASIDIVVRTEGDTVLSSFRNFYKSPYRAIGTTFIDLNQNSIFDTNDIKLQGVQIVTQPGVSSSYTNISGNYTLTTIDSVDLTLSYTPINFWGLSADSSSYNVNLNSTYPSKDSLDFGFYPDTTVNDINAEIIGGFPRCNTIANYWLDVKNKGTTTPSGVIHLQLDSSISYASSATTPDSINGQHIYWHYDSLFFFSNEQINLQVLMPDFNSLGDSLSSYLNVSVIDSLGNQVFLASDTLNPILVCAYDPNDKIADPVGIDSLGYISPNTKHIEYTVRFQNTGNDTAITVNILDQLDTNLIWNTLTPLASSHPLQIDIDQNGEVTFKFENILLPDSNADFLGSQGFVKYKINLKPSLAPGTSILNTANIYFDQNPAVITNTKINTIYDCTGLVQNTISNLSVCQNDTISGSVLDDLSTTKFNWNIPNVYNSTESSFSWATDTSGVFNLTLSTTNSACSKDTIIVLNVNSLPNITLASFNPNTLCVTSSAVALPVGSPSGGTYMGTGVVGSNFDPVSAGVGIHDIIYTYTDSNSCINSDTTTITVNICTSIDNVNSDFGILIYPNPNTGLFTIEKPSDLKKEVQVRVLDAAAKLIIEKTIPVGQQKIEVDITNHSKGIYFLQLIVDDEVFVKQILKD